MFAAGCAVDIGEPEDMDGVEELDESGGSEDADEAEVVSIEALGPIGNHTYALATAVAQNHVLRRLRLDVNEPDPNGAPVSPYTFRRVRQVGCITAPCETKTEEGLWSLTRNATTGRTYIKFRIGVQDILGNDKYEYKRGTSTDPDGLRMRWVTAQDAGAWFNLDRV